MKLSTIVLCGFVLSGCASSRTSEPNLLQRAKVLSQNEYGITIEHSEWGKAIAFRLADDHCGAMKKASFYRGGTMQTGPDMMSTWRCE